MQTTAHFSMPSERLLPVASLRWLGWLLIVPCVLFACVVGIVEVRTFHTASYAGVDVPLAHVLNPVVYAAYARWFADNVSTGWWFLHPHIFAIYTCCALITICRMEHHCWMKSAQIGVGFVSLFILAVAVCMDMIGQIFPIMGR